MEEVAAFCEPAYGVRSLGDIVPAAAHALGSPLGPAPTGLVLPEASSYVVFLIDGLGARLLERYAHAAPYLSSLLESSAPATAFGLSGTSRLPVLVSSETWRIFTSSRTSPQVSFSASCGSRSPVWRPTQTQSASN